MKESQTGGAINYSIIIPHYNIPDLLMRCLKSIPVREDVQVIVVDDCSPDAATYRGRYPELSRPYLELYSTEKGGSAGRARNVGLKHAKGKWLIFADADDLFSESFNAILGKHCDEACDMMVFNCRFVNSSDINEHVQRGDNYFIKRLFSTDNKEVLARCDCPMPWGKIIRRSLVEAANAQFSPVRWSNDILFSTIVGCSAQSLSLINEEMYISTSRSESLTSKFCSSKAELIQRTVESIKAQSIINKYGYKLDEYVCLPYLTKCYYRDFCLFLTALSYSCVTVNRLPVLYQLSKKIGRKAILKTIIAQILPHRQDEEFRNYTNHSIEI